MKLPWTVLPLLELNVNPVKLSEMRLPSPAEEPPTWFPLPDRSATPALALPSGRVPVTSVPMKLPWTTELVAWETSTPKPVFPETRLHAPVHGPPGVVPVGPPTTFPSLDESSTPFPFGTATVPVGSVPM